MQSPLHVLVCPKKVISHVVGWHAIKWCHCWQKTICFTIISLDTTAATQAHSFWNLWTDVPEKSWKGFLGLNMLYQTSDMTDGVSVYIYMPFFIVRSAVMKSPSSKALLWKHHCQKHCCESGVIRSTDWDTPEVYCCRLLLPFPNHLGVERL